MDLRSSEVVVVGAFNPAIISPEWLARQGIVKPPAERLLVDLEFRVGPRGAQEIVFTLDECRWTVSPERLILEPQTPEDPAPRVGQILELLPHTPVRALGLNFRFDGRPEDWRGGLPTLEGRRASDAGVAGDVLQRTWSVGVQRPQGGRLNLSVRSTDSMITVDFNFHRDTPDIDAVKAELAHFDRDRRAAREILAVLSRTQDRGIG